MADKIPSKPDTNESDPRKRDYIKKMMSRPNMKRPAPIKGFKTFIHKRRPAISEVVREPTAGGIVFRRNQKGGVQFLLIQDAKDRWTIPKGHIEEGEDSKTTAEREIREETGLQEMQILHWLGKINFRYRRMSSLVLMTTEIFLVRARGDSDKLQPEDWMNDCKWLDAKDALEKIEYEDIGKLMLVALTKIRKGSL
ncbi:MAG: NUDIX domain-containing protein [bacterium]|nr:NUDIX domain-containing protein [bacterium]